MGKEVSISKIVIRIGDKDIPLTVDEAKELKEALGHVLGEERIITIPSPYPVYPDRWCWHGPYWTTGITAGTTVTFTSNNTSS